MEQNYSVFDVSAALREHGWLVPAYTFPANREDLSVLRIVVRNGFTHDLADLLLATWSGSCTSCGPRPPLSVTAARWRSPTAPDHIR
jgi:glutamate/tyrosine decarboxylase-like PLP-dependent enzyme